MMIYLRKKRWLTLMGIVILIVMLGAIPCLAERKGSIFQMAGNVRVEKDEIVDGNVQAMAGNVTIYGVVNGNVEAMAGNITVYGKVDGDIQCTAGNIYVRDEAEVTGNVTALAGKIFKDENATILGSTVQAVGTGNYNDHWESNFYVSPHITWLVVIWGVVTGLISWLALGAILMLFFSRQVERLAEVTVKRPGYYFLVGFIAFLLAPPVAVLMLITIVGIPVAPLLILGVIVGTIFGQLGIARFIGSKLITKFNLKAKTEMAKVLIGILTMFVITMVPLLGWLFFFVTACMGFGSALINRFGIEKKEDENSVA